MEQWTLCLALNSMPRSCREFRFEYYERVKETNLDKHPDFRNGVGIFHPFPELYTSFIDAFEVTSEVLISPIEVCPNLLSAYQVQELYFAKSQRMKSITSPWVSERDRIGQFNVPIAKSVLSFSDRILLVSPPLIFQQHRDDRDCNISAMYIMYAKYSLNNRRCMHTCSDSSFTVRHTVPHPSQSDCICPSDGGVGAQDQTGLVTTGHNLSMHTSSYTSRRQHTSADAGVARVGAQAQTGLLDTA